MIQWRVFYDDGSEVDNTTHDIDRVPVDGVVVIVQRHDDPDDHLRAGRELLYDRDFYYWEHDRWYKADQYGRDDYLRRDGWKRVLAGRNTSTKNYHDLKLRAEQDPDFPPKSAWLPGEKRVNDVVYVGGSAKLNVKKGNVFTVNTSEWKLNDGHG